MTREWPCPKCGRTDYWTKDTARDEDGTIVRLRVCPGCGYRRSTEERVIGEGTSAFYARADSRRAATRRQEHRRRGRQPCRWCGQLYAAGSFGRHVRRSAAHAAAIRPRMPAARDYQRAYQRRSRARLRASG